MYFQGSELWGPGEVKENIKDNSEVFGKSDQKAGIAINQDGENCQRNRSGEEQEFHCIIIKFEILVEGSKWR